MVCVNRRITVYYSAENMFRLVNNIELYPEFLPWCYSANIEEHKENRLRAKLKINFYGFTETVVTDNVNISPKNITIYLVQGPFKDFLASWNFKALKNNACEVQFKMQYEFSNRTLGFIIKSVFDIISRTLIESFYKRAMFVYGSN